MRFCFFICVLHIIFFFSLSMYEESLIHRFDSASKMFSTFYFRKAHQNFVIAFFRQSQRHTNFVFNKNFILTIICRHCLCYSSIKLNGWYDCVKIFKCMPIMTYYFRSKALLWATKLKKCLLIDRGIVL